MRCSTLLGYFLLSLAIPFAAARQHLGLVDTHRRHETLEHRRHDGGSTHRRHDVLEGLAHRRNGNAWEEPSQRRYDALEDHPHKRHAAPGDHPHKRHDEDAPMNRSDGELVRRQSYSDVKFTYFVDGLGACGETNTASDYIVALDATLYDASDECFKTISITSNGKTATATITDRCPGCPSGGLDMSEGLFQFFDDLSVGVIYGSWSYVDGSETTSTSSTPVATPTTTSSTYVAPPTSSTSVYTPPTTSSTPTPTTTSTTPTPTTTSTTVQPTTSLSSYSSSSEVPTSTSEVTASSAVSASTTDATVVASATSSAVTAEVSATAVAVASGTIAQLNQLLVAMAGVIVAGAEVNASATSS